jgi:hypothetical protein
MDKELIARASVTINAPSEKVWDALVNPEAIRQYMFGTNVVSDWREGSPITWRGEWQGQPPLEARAKACEVSADTPARSEVQLHHNPACEKHEPQVRSAPRWGGLDSHYPRALLGPGSTAASPVPWAG